MTTYFEAPDGHDESTLWAPNPDRPSHPLRVVSQGDVNAPFWPDVVARMTGTTITTNVDKQHLVDAARDAYIYGVAGSTSSTAWLNVVDAILAALTGVPHD